ncbi:early growth response protein, putative [Schistosoma mansoni]|uniref:early growth response protein, putative n=1 Tax=Schistosoma mansoni TaxID=6183 RepID=UPI00022C8674|nr:early growth response protein, putative [Schistosoma mansoni]|eukprot:XP_018644245.1 early growth response protein, putative [Schistosoma mansoni]
MDDIHRTNSVLAINELSNCSGDTSITTTSTIDVIYTNSNNNNSDRSYQSLTTNTLVANRSNTDAEFCMVSNSTPVMFNGGVTSPGNYKKILIDRYLLSQSMSHCGTIYESINPFTKMVHVPLLQGEQTDLSNEKAMKVPLNTDTNYHLETKSTIPEELINRKESNSSDNQIRNFQSLLRKLLCDILTRELLANKYKDKPYMIQSTVSSNHKRYCNTFNPNVTLQNPIITINDRIYNPDSSNTETKLSFNSENYEEAISTPCFDPNVGHEFLNELQSLLRNNCYSNGMKASDHQPTAMQILSHEKNSSLYTCLGSSKSSLLKINPNNQLTTPLLGMRNSVDKLLCPEVIKKNSVDASKPKHSQKSFYHSLAETSMSRISKDFINNNNTVNTTTTTTVFSPNFLHSLHCSVKNPNIQNSTLNSLLLVCSQPCTTMSIDSELSTLTSSTCSTHKQQQYPSVETSVSHPSSPLFKYRHPMGISLFYCPYNHFYKKCLESRKTLLHMVVVFTRSDMLVRHAHVHTGHKPFECTICGQAFSRSDHLSTHQRTHTGQRPYQCSLCYYSASRRDMITRHLRVHQRKFSLEHIYNLTGKIGTIFECIFNLAHKQLSAE